MCLRSRRSDRGDEGNEVCIGSDGLCLCVGSSVSLCDLQADKIHTLSS